MGSPSMIALLLLLVSIPAVYAAAFPGQPPPAEMNNHTAGQLFVQRLIQPTQRRHRTVKRSEVVSGGACTATSEGKLRFACPMSREENRCIEDRQLCNGRHDCPLGEDENQITCFFYKFITSHMNSAIRSLGTRSHDSSSTAT